MSAIPTATQPIDRILPRLQGVQHKRTSRPYQWGALCPAHPDSQPSLRVTEAPDGKVLLKCWSGHCTAQAIVDAIGLKLADLFPTSSRRGGRVRVTAYEYRAGDGTLIAIKERHDHPDGHKETQRDPLEGGGRQLGPEWHTDPEPTTLPTARTAGRRPDRAGDLR